MKLVIKDCAPWDGEYECDVFGLTNREYHRIKVISEGVRPAELVEALDANDTGAYVGLAVVVLDQHGLKVDPDDFWDARVGTLMLDLGVSTDPPTIAASNGGPSEKSAGSGGSSTTAGDRPVSDPEATGNHGLETDATSSLVMDPEAVVT